MHLARGTRPARPRCVGPRRVVRSPGPGRGRARGSASRSPSPAGRRARRGPPPHQSAATSRSTLAKAAVSASSWPLAGSSRRSTFGRGGERARQLHDACLAGGESVGARGGQARDAEPLEQLVGHPVGLRPPGDVGGQAHVLADGQQPEQLEALERAGQAVAGPLERRQSGHVRAVEEHTTRAAAAAGRR